MRINLNTTFEATRSRVMHYVLLDYFQNDFKMSTPVGDDCYWIFTRCFKMFCFQVISPHLGMEVVLNREADTVRI